MNARLPRVLIFGLSTLVVGLFIATFLLNRSQYAASASSVGFSFNLALEQQVETLQGRIAQQEVQSFSHHKTAQILEADLFIIQDDRVVPACIAGLLEQVPMQAANKAFEQGVAAGSSSAAISFFQVAAKRPVASPEDLYLKISVYFNLLDFQYNVQTVCCILALLDHSDPSLPASQRTFFLNLLREQVPDLEAIRRRTSSLWKTASLIDQKLARKKGAYRASIGDQTLSIRENRLALLYSPDLQALPPVQIAHTAPNGLHEEIIPGQVAFIPSTAIDEAKLAIRKQHRIGNAILALLVVLGCTLGGGIVLASRRQRELDAMKTEFIATVSHELRTPLSLIRLHAETLHHGRIPDSKVDDYHQTILTEAERLTGIVNNVLDFSRMERGKMQINLEPTNLSEATERIVESFRYRLEKEGFELDRQIAPDVVAPADALAYSQILFNLIDNAIKYSDTKKRIRIELESGKDWNTLRVSDLGIGIPDKLKKKVFDDFVRADDHKVTARRGSGIGLSVARRLVEEMNGTIEVKDNAPTGSVFTVRLRNNDETIGG